MHRMRNIQGHSKHEPLIIGIQIFLKQQVELSQVHQLIFKEMMSTVCPLDVLQTDFAFSEEKIFNVLIGFFKTPASSSNKYEVIKGVNSIFEELSWSINWLFDDFSEREIWDGSI